MSRINPRLKDWVQRSTRIEKVTLLFGIVLLLHFGVSLGIWGLMIGVETSRAVRLQPRSGLWTELIVWSPWFVRSGKAFLPFVLAGTSIWMLNRSTRAAASLIVTAVGLSVLLFGHDAATESYDYTTYDRRYPAREICRYATWWWYSHPAR